MDNLLKNLINIEWLHYEENFLYSLNFCDPKEGKLKMKNTNSKMKT